MEANQNFENNENIIIIENRDQAENQQEAERRKILESSLLDINKLEKGEAEFKNLTIGELVKRHITKIEFKINETLLKGEAKTDYMNDCFREVYDKMRQLSDHMFQQILNSSEGIREHIEKNVLAKMDIQFKNIEMQFVNTNNVHADVAVKFNNIEGRLNYFENKINNIENKVNNIENILSQIIKPPLQQNNSFLGNNSLGNIQEMNQNIGNFMNNRNLQNNENNFNNIGVNNNLNNPGINNSNFNILGVNSNNFNHDINMNNLNNLNNNNLNNNFNNNLNNNLNVNSNPNNFVISKNAIPACFNGVQDQDDLWLAESIILEKEKINGNYEADEAGTKFIYMLQHVRNRLEFRPIRRQITQEELIQQWAYFYKVNSPEGDVAYEVMLKAKNFQMDKFIGKKLTKIRTEFDPIIANSGTNEDYYHKIHFNSSQIQFKRHINRGNGRFNCNSFFIRKGLSDKFMIYVNGNKQKSRNPMINTKYRQYPTKSSFNNNGFGNYRGNNPNIGRNSPSNVKNYNRGESNNWNNSRGNGNYQRGNSSRNNNNFRGNSNNFRGNYNNPRGNGSYRGVSGPRGNGNYNRFPGNYNKGNNPTNYERNSMKNIQSSMKEGFDAINNKIANIESNRYVPPIWGHPMMGQRPSNFY